MKPIVERTDDEEDEEYMTQSVPSDFPIKSIFVPELHSLDDSVSIPTISAHSDLQIVSFGMFMEEKRTSIPMTLMEVSQASGISIASLSRYENGYCAKLSREKLYSWSKALLCDDQDCEFTWSLFCSTVDTYKRAMGLPMSPAVSDLRRLCRRHEIPIDLSNGLYRVFETSFEELLRRH